MRRLPHLLLMLCMCALVGLSTAGCGDEEGCQSDHDCSAEGDRKYVCEPDGCKRACSNDNDCRATDKCTDRRVEPGQACTTVRETL